DCAVSLLSSSLQPADAPRSTRLPYTTLFRSRDKVATRTPRPRHPGPPKVLSSMKPPSARSLRWRYLRTAVSTPPRLARNHTQERSEEHTSELQSHLNLVCRLLLEKKNREHHT